MIAGDDQLRTSGKTDQYVDQEIAACRAASNQDDPTAS